VAVQDLQEMCALLLSSLLEGCSDGHLPIALARDLDMQKILKILRVSHSCAFSFLRFYKQRMQFE
jgi:hypothetical protein